MKVAKAQRIGVRNAQRKLRLAMGPLQIFAEAALRKSLRNFPARQARLEGIEEIVIILISDRRSAELHRRFMNIAGATDVITFQHGEVFISVETAAANAKRFRTTVDAEIRLYMVHGILHLLGFDDTTPRAAALMQKTQSRIVREASAAKAMRRPV